MMTALVFHSCISGYEAFFSIPTHTVAQGGRTGSISYCMSYISNQSYSTLHFKFHLVFEPFHNNIQYCFSNIEIYLPCMNRNAHFIMFQSTMICAVLVYTWASILNSFDIQMSPLPANTLKLDCFLWLK